MSTTETASSVPTTEKKEEADCPAESNDTESRNYIPQTELPEVKQEENSKIGNRGRIAGGSYLAALNGSDTDSSDEGPLKEVDIDMPLSLTEVVEKDGKEYIVVRFTDDDKTNPFNWAMAWKAWITFLLCALTLLIGLATTAYSSTIDPMTKDLHVDKELGELGLFCFNFTCAIVPLFLAPFCELVGTRIVYVGSYAVFIICFIGLALGKNIATILMMRVCCGLFGCVGTILVGGTLSDIFHPDKRATPMACWAFVAIFGTVAAPIYAGYVVETIGWRWLEGIQGMANIPLCLALLFTLRETRGGVGLHKRAYKLREATGDERYRAEVDLETKNIKDMLYASSVKSVHMLITEPVVLAFGLWIAFAWFVTFLFLSVIGITFGEKRGWDTGNENLPYASLCVGVTMAFAANFLQIRKYDKIMRENNGKIMPESRLYGAMWGAPFLPIGLFIYSFTQYGYLSWVGPTIALAPIAIGIFFIFESTYSYTSDCYGENAGSALAGQGFLRNTTAGVAPLFASAFFHNLGSQWAGLLLACLAALMAPIPFVMFKYGHKLRASSKLCQSQDNGDEQKKKTGLYTGAFL